MTQRLRPIKKQVWLAIREMIRQGLNCPTPLHLFHYLKPYRSRFIAFDVSAHENGPTLRSENGPTRLMR
jgi:hypothetical protein